jgi:hypothetical protein
MNKQKNAYILRQRQFSLTVYLVPSLCQEVLNTVLETGDRPLCPSVTTWFPSAKSQAQSFVLMEIFWAHRRH